MQIRHKITNFKKPAYICKRQSDSNYVYNVGEVYNYDEVEHCIIQALYDKDDSYFLKINNQEINLLDEDIFDKVYAIYPNQMSYANITYNIISSLRKNKHNKEELQKYNQVFGTKFKTK